MGKGSMMPQCLILIDASSSACWETKLKKKKREAAKGLFSLGKTCLAGCATWGFHGF
jgi:hypothetical protein